MSETRTVWQAFLEGYGIQGRYGTDSYYDALLETHAHEIAEEIREVATDDPQWAEVADPFLVADTIDPDICPHLTRWENCKICMPKEAL